MALSRCGRFLEVLAGEQGSGTFVRVAGESDALRARSRATVDAVEVIEPSPTPSLPSAGLQRQGIPGPYRRAQLRVSFPLVNIGRELPTLAATLAGTLYDLGESTGVRLQHITVPAQFRARFERPRHGVAGTRTLTGVAPGPIIGTIVKPKVGLSADETAALVADLCRAGVDFIKDDECCGDLEHAPIEQRIRAVLAAVRAHRDASGKSVMVALHISDEHEATLRHAELLQQEGGCCALVRLNWVGFSSLQALRRRSDLVLHGHCNGFGMFARHPALGIDFQPDSLLWRQ
jgi:ribulose-bisphosphate carboxylase large chain